MYPLACICVQRKTKEVGEPDGVVITGVHLDEKRVVIENRGSDDVDMTQWTIKLEFADQVPTAPESEISRENEHALLENLVLPLTVKGFGEERGQRGASVFWVLYGITHVCVYVLVCGCGRGRKASRSPRTMHC